MQTKENSPLSNRKTVTLIANTPYNRLWTNIISTKKIIKMSLQVMKLAISAETTTNIDPDSIKFFYVATTQINGGSSTTIQATQFFQSDGTPATEFLDSFNPFPNLYINGVLQMMGIYFILADGFPWGTEWSLQIDLPAGSDPILTGTPIILEYKKYAPSSTTTVTS
ncbi:DUF4183 domain-containing protein [Bacillus mycoides]|uniref:DUF4183 domain-containing protein n=1 Tax=Bacillus mycoides TaxID=1405 RepID=UPI003D254DC4